VEEVGLGATTKIRTATASAAPPSIRTNSRFCCGHLRARPGCCARPV
jgi:hypothetical protein